MSATREDRIAQHQRNEKWQNPPVRIEMPECINCDACLRACPPQFGAIFNFGTDVEDSKDLKREYKLDTDCQV